MTPTTASQRTWLDRLARLPVRAWRMEVGAWQSIYRLVFRRKRVPTGADAFAYHGPILSILIIFIALSVVELVVVDLIVHQWPAVRIPLLILGIWGVTWMLGLLFGYITRPHSVGPDGIIVRAGPEIDVSLPWRDIQSVAPVKTVYEPKSPRIIDDTLRLRMQDETNIEIELEYPVEIRLPDGRYHVNSVHLWADDPRAFLVAVRDHITPDES